MIIYHGSKDIVSKPIYGKGKASNDYGLGFYCTESNELASEWSVTSENDGYVNSYEIDLKKYNVLHLEKYSMMHWLCILLENRTFSISDPLTFEAKEYIIKNFHIDTTEYDVIIGYRADDSYFSFAQDFLRGTISYRQLCNAMKLGKLGLQIVLKSKKAFEEIKYIKSDFVDKKIWFEKKKSRDKKAREDYFNSERNKRTKDDIYIIQIMNEEMKFDDIRLR